MRRHRVPLEALAEGRAVVTIDGRDVALFLIDGTVHAFENACPHAGNPLVEGEISGPMLVCVYHGWRFDLETGACLAGERPARRYRTEVRDDAVFVDVDG